MYIIHYKAISIDNSRRFNIGILLEVYVQKGTFLSIEPRVMRNVNNKID